MLSSCHPAVVYTGAGDEAALKVGQQLSCTRWAALRMLWWGHQSRRLTTPMPLPSLPACLPQVCADAGMKVHAFDDFLASGAGADVAPVPPQPDDMCCIMYTRWVGVCGWMCGCVSGFVGVGVGVGRPVGSVRCAPPHVLDRAPALPPRPPTRPAPPPAQRHDGHPQGRDEHPPQLRGGRGGRALHAGAGARAEGAAPRACAAAQGLRRAAAPLPPSPCRLTHRAPLPPATPQAGIGFTADDCVLSYLPLAHSFDRIIEELALCVGAHIGYWRVRRGVLGCWGAGKGGRGRAVRERAQRPHRAVAHPAHAPACLAAL